MPETSARLPAETNVESPSPRSAAAARMAMPRAPDWQKKPTRPRPGSTGARVALRLTWGSVFATPRAPGPTTRMPCALAAWTILRSASRPSSLRSLNPAETTTNAFTPFARQSSSTSSTPPAGTATTARSTGSGISRTEA